MADNNLSSIILGIIIFLNLEGNIEGSSSLLRLRHNDFDPDTTDFGRIDDLIYEKNGVPKKTHFSR